MSGASSSKSVVYRWQSFSMQQAHRKVRRDSRSSEGKNGKYNVLREEITVHRCRVMFTIISSRHCMPLP